MASKPAPMELPDITSQSLSQSNVSPPAGRRSIASSAQSIHHDASSPPVSPAQMDQLQPGQLPPSNLRQNIFMIFITLTQLVQMIPLGAGINSSLSIGEALGATPVQSVWIVASYPLTQGSFVLIGKVSIRSLSGTSLTGTLSL